MKKKKLYLIGAIIVNVIIVLIIIYILTAHHKTINYVNTDKVSQVRVQNGSNGESVMLDASAEDTKKILDLLSGTKCTKVKEFDQTGWSYTVTMLDKEGKRIEVICFISTKLCEIDDRKYEIDPLDGEKIFALLGKVY
jgi:uncharacterized membrane protein